MDIGTLYHRHEFEFTGNKYFGDRIMTLMYVRCHLVCLFYIYGILFILHVNPYPTAFPYGNGMVLHFYQQQESSTTKTVHKVINKGLKTYV